MPSLSSNKRPFSGASANPFQGPVLQRPFVLLRSKDEGTGACGGMAMLFALHADDVSSIPHVEVFFIEYLRLSAGM